MENQTKDPWKIEWKISLRMRWRIRGMIRCRIKDNELNNQDGSRKIRWRIR